MIYLNTEGVGRSKSLRTGMGGLITSFGWDMDLLMISPRPD